MQHQGRTPRQLLQKMLMSDREGQVLVLIVHPKDSSLELLKDLQQFLLFLKLPWPGWKGRCHELICLRTMSCRPRTVKGWRHHRHGGSLLLHRLQVVKKFPQQPGRRLRQADPAATEQRQLEALPDESEPYSVTGQELIRQGKDIARKVPGRR